MATDTYDQLGGPIAPLAVPKRALTVGAHPDDAEFGAGAALARWAADGAVIAMLILTDGSKGSWDPDIPDDELVALRRAEQGRAAAVLGVDEVVHLTHVDGDLEHRPALVDEVADLIRRFRPSVVLGHDPWQRYQLHPDHRAAGWVVTDAVVRAREARASRASTFEAHRVDALLLWSADEPDHAEPVSDPWFDRKVEALLCHTSQATTTMAGADRGPDERAAFVAQLRDWHRRAGERLGAPPSETFKRITP